jgi:hypothetical protein
MEAVALGLISLPFRDGLDLPARLAWDAFAGLAGTATLLIVIFGLRRVSIPRSKILTLVLPTLAGGAVFLVSIFISEIAIEKLFLSWGLGPVTLLWNGVAADAFSVLVATAALRCLGNRFGQRIPAALPIYVAVYEALFVAWQLGGLPAVLAWLGIAPGWIYAVSLLGWGLGGFFASASVVAAFNRRYRAESPAFAGFRTPSDKAAAARTR